MRTLMIRPSPAGAGCVARLEPLGLERVAAAARAMGHEVRVADAHVASARDLNRQVRAFRPEAAGLGVGCLADVPAALEQASRIRREFPRCFTFAGGPGVSAIAGHVLRQADGTLDAVVRGEGEVATPLLLAAARDGGLADVPGTVTSTGACPRAPLALEGIDDPRPARDLLRGREKYVIGALAPAASIEFGRGDRLVSPQAAAAQLSAIREWCVYVVDDTAFTRPEHGSAIAAELEQRRARKRYCVRTAAGVLRERPELFRRWHRLGLRHAWLSMDPADPERDMRALELARGIGITVTVELLVDPGWDIDRFRAVRAWARSVPETVRLAVRTPYPGTPAWAAESRRLTTGDYRLFDGHHAVVPTALPLDRFYRELALTRAVANRKDPDVCSAGRPRGPIGRAAGRGRASAATAFGRLRSMSAAERAYRDHLRAGPYALPGPAPWGLRGRSGEPRGV